MTPTASARASRKPPSFVPATPTLPDSAEVNASPATERTGLLLTGKYPPFLPRNFYEAPQYASLRPPRAITLAGHIPSPVTACKSAAIVPSACDADVTAERTTTYRETARPVSRKNKWLLEVQASEINCRLDNLHLRLENYIQAHQQDSSIDLGAPSWRRSNSTIHRDSIQALPEPASSPGTKKGRGRPKKIEVNRLKPYLQGFTFPRDALSALPMFDDIVKGVVVADAGGNTRPFSKTRMVAFLQGLDVISADAIRQQEPKWTLRHAQKVAMCLRIIERHAFDCCGQVISDTTIGAFFAIFRS